MTIYLELASKKIHVTLIFVVQLGVIPDEGDLLLECIPGLEVGLIGRWRAAVYTSRALCDALERNRVPDGFVVVFQLTRG